MGIELSPKQQEFIEDLVASGRFSSAGEAVGEGVRLLAAQEILKQQVSVGIEQADRGDLTDHATVFAQLRAMAAAASDE